MAFGVTPDSGLRFSGVGQQARERNNSPLSSEYALLWSEPFPLGGVVPGMTPDVRRDLRGTPLGIVSRDF